MDRASSRFSDPAGTAVAAAQEQIILELLEQKFSEEAIARCKYLSEQGYRLAVDNFQYLGYFYNILPYVSYAKVDVLEQNKEQTWLTRGLLLALRRSS